MGDECNGNCDDEFDACMGDKSECLKDYTNRQCKKKCKKNRSDCKNACAAATKCPVCEDNDISGFGTPWCVMNAVATFCASAEGATKCKKTCDLCAYPYFLLYTSAATTHMTSRAGGAAEDAAAVMHLDLLTPARRPDPRSSDVRLYIYIYSSDPNRNIASEANQNDVKDDHFGLGCGLNKFSYFR